MKSGQIMKAITEGQTFLGIELGSTRIKAVLIGPDHLPIAYGSHSWENRLDNGVWTYHLDDVWAGIQDCYKCLAADVLEKFAIKLTKIGAIGISAMMHGYLVFDEQGKLLTPFRTWRNTMTEQAADDLSKLFGFNIPQRWSIAHLYQAVLNDEKHVKDIAFQTTLAGYVHYQLTGEKVLGVGDASGVFPIDEISGDYHPAMLGQWEDLVKGRGFGWSLKDILPKVLGAGESAGTLTQTGAKLLDPSGNLECGISFCPPEGDAGTGMTATNSIAERTGNVSAGTSVFAMVVLEKSLNRIHPEIDMVTTPTGKPVAMVHCNNCSSDLDAWVRVFGELFDKMNVPYDLNTLYEVLYNAALAGDSDCGGLLSYNYLSGEHNTGLHEGRPLFVRLSDAKFTLENFMLTHLYSAIATLRLGMDILFEEEKVGLDCLLGHGGFFKTKGVGQQIMAAAMGVPVAVMETAGEGGAWGAALLAAFLYNKKPDQTLADYLKEHVFKSTLTERAVPDQIKLDGFNQFMKRFKQGLEIERTAVDNLNS